MGKVVEKCVGGGVGKYVRMWEGVGKCVGVWEW